LIEKGEWDFSLVLVIVATLNEEEGIMSTIMELRQHLRALRYEEHAVEKIQKQVSRGAS